MTGPRPDAAAESDRSGPATPRIRVLDALRELDAELARLHGAARSDAELRAAIADFVASLETAAAHADGTTTLVVATSAFDRLRTAAAPDRPAG
ncbi:hypothetical protein [Yinghuangia soli]|uniref:Uncharacterized protein n=1 Tax=Yinghuangia soli TaxID=2908204 RepID=A0AA41U4C7_9ACTN|nr:hypothetical protein [Yinghuangia soli]MCF2530672.1 hypothetical protein [Yinghuangia soli]